MERVMAVLTDEQESFVGTISITGMSAHRACEATIVGVYLDGQRLVQKSLVGNHALQLGKGPFGGGRIRFTLLPRGFLAFLAAAALTDVCQVLQTNEAVLGLAYDAFLPHMFGVLLRPSLSTTHHRKPSTSSP